MNSLCLHLRFIFGWHVHEKATLHVEIPLAIVAAQSLKDARHYFMLLIGMQFAYVLLTCSSNLYANVVECYILSVMQYLVSHYSYSYMKPKRIQ